MREPRGESNECTQPKAGRFIVQRYQASGNFTFIVSFYCSDLQNQFLILVNTLTSVLLEV
jgi:hypothetical protein